MTDKFLTVEALATLLGMSEQAIYAACRNKQLPHIKIGKRIRVPESALQEWVAAQLVPSAPPKVVNNFVIQAPRGSVSAETQQQILTKAAMGMNAALARNT